MKYSCLAPFYDAIMWHVDYNEWAQLIKKVVRKYISSANISVFEIGAGTGSLAKKLISFKYDYQGSDLSFHMSKIAKSKNLSFFCADGLSIPAKKKYDIVLFLYDGINYLKNLSEYKKLFTSVSSILKPNGLFLFDITTETNSRRYFSDFHSCEDVRGSTIFRYSYFLENRSQQCNEFQIFTPSPDNPDLYMKSSEKHVQKIVSPNQIESVIPAKHFHTVGIWDGFTTVKYNKYSERIHFLLQKK